MNSAYNGLKKTNATDNGKSSTKATGDDATYNADGTLSHTGVAVEGALAAALALGILGTAGIVVRKRHSTESITSEK